jgi:NAD(P)-dependent dehydrogenase (short-subunit alcohol dehydrogenase family)
VRSDANATHQIGPTSTFVVSGGGRGITAACVVGLARRYGCRFVLFGRSSIAGVEPEWAGEGQEDAELMRDAARALRAGGERPTPLQVQAAVDAVRARREIEATLREVAAAGGQADYVSADVADAVALQEALRRPLRRLGPVTGIIHGAGSISDRLIERKTGADFDRVFAPKVRGLQNLLACVPPDGLAFLVLFSSAAGYFGNPGQADYAMANETLNKAAHLLQRAHPSCRVVALNWGPWAGGMVTPELRRLFERRHVSLIAPAAGARVLADALSSRPGGADHAVQVLVGDPPAGDPPGPPPRLNGELRTHRIRRRLTLDANPFLRDHVIGGRAVLPMVCSMVWIANAAEQVAPGFRFATSREHRVLKGIVFDDSLAGEYCLDLRETARSEHEIAFEALIWSQAPGGQTRYHYSAELTLRDALPEPPRCADVDLTEREPVDGASLYGDRTLFHGPAFRGVERVLNITPQRMTMRCLVPPVTPGDQGQFPVQTLNPFVADVQFQGLVIWARRFRGVASLPLRAQRGEHFRAVPPGAPFYVTLQVRADSGSAVVADVLTHDRAGLLFTRLTGGEATLSEALNPLFRAGSEGR